MRPKGSAKELEVRRRIAGRLLLQGKGVREVARLVDVSPSSASRWKRAVEAGGLEALKAKPHPGRKPALAPRQKEDLKQILIKGPLEAGFPTDLWTLSRVAEVIVRTFGVSYHPGHVWYLLRRSRNDGHGSGMKPPLSDGDRKRGLRSKKGARARLEHRCDR